MEKTAWMDVTQQVACHGQAGKDHSQTSLGIVLDASNGKSESMNSRIQKVKARSHGEFRNAIYFHLGDLNLYPHSKESAL